MEFKRQSEGSYVAKLGPLEVHVFAGLEDWDLIVQRKSQIGAHKWLVQMRLSTDYPTPEAAMADAEIIVPPILEEMLSVLKEASRAGIPLRGVSALKRVAGDDPV
jgi:hypothetical protein